jgi:hypothetical protein
LGWGLALRPKSLVVRIDTALSDEDVGLQMMVNHPFFTTVLIPFLILESIKEIKL